jgi:hypothetical protein
MLIAIWTLTTKNKEKLPWAPGDCGIQRNDEAMSWLERDQAICFLVPSQQFQSHHVSAGSRLRNDWTRCTLNTGLPCQVWDTQSSSLTDLWKNRLVTYWPWTRQCWLVTGLLTGHCTLRQHLHIMRLTDNPICRKCRQDEESSYHIYNHLPLNIKSLSKDIKQFKSLLRNYLIEHTFYTIDEFYETTSQWPLQF